MNPEFGGKPFFSIVTACLNSEVTLTRCLQSLLDQSYGNFELIVVDGNSSDRTLEIAEAFTIKFRVKGIPVTIRSEPAHGIYDAINKGISLSAGAVIGILNSDDFYPPQALEHVYGGFSLNEKSEIVYGLLRQWKNGKELAVYRYNYDYILSSLESGIESAAQHPACFVRKSVYERIGTFDTTFPIAADYDFLLRAKRAGVVFMSIDVIVSNFVLGGASSQMTVVDNIEQRYRAQHNNGLISDNEYRSRRRYLTYVRFAQWRKNLLCRLTGVQG
jgi:glycosyltransferase involved in cell wall biosynthesis